MQSTSRLMPSGSTSTSAPNNTPPDTALGTPVARSPWRIWVVVAFMLLLLAALVAQLLRYQLFPSKIEEGTTAATVMDTRGAIVDHNGTPLVVNRYFFELTVTPAHIKTPEERHEIAQQLQELIALPYQQTFDTLTNSAGLMWAKLADAITLEDARKIAAKQQALNESRSSFPLMYVEAVPMTKRYYPQAELTSHLLGFVQPNLGGVTGIEEYYNGFLLQHGAGLLGQKSIPVNTLSQDVLRFVPSSVGKDLVLTLDSTVQWILREELMRGLEEFKAVSGTAIAMDPHTGAIYGMVSLPDYDPNRYEMVPQESYNLFNNPAVSAQYEPGSVYKIITMAAALDAGDITPTTIFTDSGSITIGGRVIFNSTRTANGRVSATDALALSLNVVTAQIAEDLGPEKFYRYVRLFGFGEATNVDLSGEINGIIKTPRDPNWSPADLGTNSFGQGLACTPLQMLNATAVIANGGRLVQPYIVEARVAGGQAQVTEPVVARQVIKPETAQEMAEMMTAVVDSNGSLSGVPGYSVAGKSGTAQIPSPEGYVQRETIVSYVGFAPANDPKFVLLVKMDRPDPEINVWAGQTAGPVFSRISQRLLDHFSVPPDDLRLAAASGSGE
ncbi:MAG: penicillin-binding protein 2 [Caldilineaceae bacterium]|nr:penicillin-binding protein 2 [Caldilineaceae bacterium]